MATLRFDPTTSDWVIFAPSRSLRPHDRAPKAVSQEVLHDGGNCPFCPGNEAFTPPEIYRVSDPTGPGSWQVRVFPNKFPALRIEEHPQRETDGNLFQFMGGCGAHEVIVESPDHRLFLGQQPLHQVERVLRALQFRYQDLMRDRRFQTVIIFKNHGAEAGTSLSHPHWQLIATPVVPRLLRLKHFEASEFFDRTGACLYAVIREQELAVGKRVLATNDDFVAFMPFASHMPFETWIVPRSGPPSFRHLPVERLQSLAELLKIVLLELHTALNNPAFNLTVDDVPRGDEDKEYFLWHIRILPRLTNPAGFELGSGMAINTVLPEDAVAFLTEVAVAENSQIHLGAA